MRIVGLDLGKKRIGVAVVDDRAPVAVPVMTVEANGDPLAVITRVLEEQNADELVVGLPLSMSGAIGPQAQSTMAVVEAIREQMNIPVHTWDERLTSAQAQRSAPRNRRGAAKGSRDAVAAAIVLQAFLDSKRSGLA